MAKFTVKSRSGANVMLVIIDGKPYNVDATNSLWNDLVEAYNNNDADLFLDILAGKGNQKMVADYVMGSDIVVTENSVTYKGIEVDNVIADILQQMRRERKDITVMVRFLENLLQNPSATAQRGLYDFLKNRNLPLTEDGCFLAYKTVLSNYWSKASGNLVLTSGKTDATGRVYNAVGERVSCPRCQVDDDRDNECSYGLHVGGLQYSGPGGSYNSPGDKVIIVKVNPKDVIAVPKDYNAQKLRTCDYTVVADYVAPMTSSTTTDSISSAFTDVEDVEDAMVIRFLKIKTRP
jgi:hypothetical protein